MKQLVVGALVALATLALSSGVAVAKSSPQAKAQSAANRIINSYFPPGPGQSGVCAARTKSGLFNNGSNYLASCAVRLADGVLQVFVIVPVTNAASLNAEPSYLRSQLDGMCKASGSAYVAGIKGRFLEVFAGAGSQVTVANGLHEEIAARVANVPGHVSTSLTC